jgi:hypothetical protein
VRPDDDTREDVTEHHWLPELAEYDGHNSGHNHDDREVLQEIDVMHTAARLYLPAGDIRKVNSPRIILSESKRK